MMIVFDLSMRRIVAESSVLVETSKSTAPSILLQSNSSNSATAQLSFTKALQVENMGIL